MLSFERNSHRIHRACAVTGFPVWATIIIVGVVSTFYTTLVIDFFFIEHAFFFFDLVYCNMV